MRNGSGGGKPRTGYHQAMALLVTHTKTFWFYETKTWSFLKVIVRDHENHSTWVSKRQVFPELQANGGRTESSHTQRWLQSFLDCRPNHPRQQTNPLYFITLQLFTCNMMDQVLHSPCLSYNSRRKRYLCCTSKSLRSLKTLNTQRVSFQANWHVKSFLVPSEFMTFPLDALKLNLQSSDTDI